MVIYLIRHATPDWSRSDLAYHVPPGPPLVEQGCQEAQTLGDFLRGAGVRRLFTSPLERCQATAEIAAAEARLTVQVEEGLIEWQPGEDQATVTARVWPVFEAALKAGDADGPVGLVSHGGPIAMLLLALGMGEAALAAQRCFDRGNPLPPAGAWEVRKAGDGDGWRLRLAFVPGESD